MKVPRRLPRERPPGTPEREAMLDAVIELVVERDFEGVSAEAIAERSGAGIDDFRREFADVTDCTLEAYWRATEDFTDLVQDAFESEGPWRDSLRASAYTAARWIRDNPLIVEFGTVRMFRTGLFAQAQRESHLHLMVDLIDCARQELEDPESMSRSAAESVFGSIYERLVKAQGEGGGVGPPENFVPELMYLAVRPYFGHEVAQEELEIPPPPQ